MGSFFLDTTPYSFHDLDFPMLVHGKKDSGASYFSIELLIELYKTGKNIIMLSGFSHSRDTFFHETYAREHSVLIEDEGALSKAEHKRIIFLKKEKMHYLEQLLHMPNMNSRFLMVKNIELFPEPLIRTVAHHKHLILSGDVDESPLKYELLKKPFQTKIYFSPLDASGVGLQVPEFSAYMVGREKEGHLTIDSPEPQE